MFTFIGIIIIVIIIIIIIIIIVIIVIAFDIGRTLPNMDLSRDFMRLVVGRSVDLGMPDCTSGIPADFFAGAEEREPGIEIGLGLSDLFVLAVNLVALFFNRLLLSQVTSNALSNLRLLLVIILIK